MRIATAACCLLLSGCTTTGGGPSDDFDLGAAMRPYREIPAITVAGDLGTETNPVRVLMPEGERSYLHRLRCDNGGPPTFERVGSNGIGPYGKILDIYKVDCGGKIATVHMDMYHCNEEAEAVPGFEIVPEIGHRPKPECQ